MMISKLRPCDSRTRCYVYGLMIAGSLWGLLVVAATLT
jgi:hypothetical protein